MVEGKGLTRREFLRLAPVVVSGAAVILNEAEKGIVRPRIRTSNADFYPHYEHHLAGVKLTDEVALDYHFIEGSSSVVGGNCQDANNPFIDIRGAKLRKGVIINSDRNFRNAQLAIRRGIPIILGDVELPPYEEIPGISKFSNEYLMPPHKEQSYYPNFKESGWNHAIATAYFLLGVAPRYVSKMLRTIGWLPQECGQSTRVSRRRMLTNLVIGSTDILAMGAAINTLIAGIWDYTYLQLTDLGTSPQKEIVQRVANRLNGLMSMAKPFDHFIFLRNAIWAHKLLDLAEKESARLGRRLNISYQVGAAHGGVEDFLALGKMPIEAILQVYPAEVLRDTAKGIPNGIFSMSSLTILKNSVGDTNNPDKGWYCSEFVIDEGLRDILTKRINV